MNILLPLAVWEKELHLVWSIQEPLQLWEELDSAKHDFRGNKWNDIDFSKVDFKTNLLNGLYDNGIAIVLGKTLPGCPYPNSFALDIDGEDAMLEWFGS